MVLATNPGVSHRFSVEVRNLAEESAAQTLHAIAARRVSRCVLPWIPLMQGDAESGIIQEWLALAEAEPDETFQRDYLALVVIFAGLAGCRPIWDRAVRELAMRRNWKRSEVVMEWQQEAREEAERTTRRESILQTLELRFHAVPEDVAAAVNGMNDRARLKRWFRHAVTAESLDAFRAAVRMPNGAAPRR
jgi:hypothetical protein